MSKDFLLPAQTSFNANSKSYFDQLSEFLSIQSISADKDFHHQAKQCANWLLEHLSRMGASLAELIQTPGLPCVFAEFNSQGDPKNSETVLFYGHYDVQPVDPVNLWDTDPFKAEIKNGRIYARGAQDNKGQLFYFLKALESTILSGTLGVNVKILLEGEEECGSVGISQTLPTIADKIKADTLLVCDTGTLDASLGAITMGLRGIVHLEIKLTGPNKDLHSGVHGGIVQNPAVELSRLISKIHDENGKILIPGFYDGIKELSKSDNFPMTEQQYQKLVGVAPLGGEKGLSMAVRRGLRPTVEVNGITSGYQGEGSKTIIPSCASCKISSRIVSGQSAVDIKNKIINFLKDNTPSGLQFECLHKDASGEGFSMSVESKVVQKAAKILTQITQTEPLYIWEGASIPLIPSLIKYSGASPLLVGFGLEEDNIHAPNESFSLDQWQKGFIFCHQFLSNICPS
jgi:acetylornithine deacetylase/succinyl-diaminopimelate desuccinylase-like protein